MKLSDLKWWHFTLATIAIAAIIRVATGGPLPFMPARAPGGAQDAAASGKLDRPERKPNQGTSITQVVNQGEMKVEAATPELQRLTLEATVPNPGNGVGVVDNTGALVVKIAQALQGGVSEDSTAVEQIRLIVAVKGQDRTGKEVAHLSLYSLTYKAADLFKMKPTTTPAAALSQSTNLVLNEQTGKDALKAWCKAGDNLNQALTFCGLVTGAKD